MIRKIIGRNLKQYFRDKTSVFFSLLAVFIVIVLYILFLAQVQIDSILESAEGAISNDKIAYLINSWILAGLLSITTVTSTLGAFGTMVGDYEKHKIMDFKSSPLKQMDYPIANILSSFIVGSIISLLSFAVYGSYIVISTGYMYPIESVLNGIGIILLSALMSAALMGFIVSNLKTNSAFSSVSLVIGTIIGFLNGLYVPIGSLPDAVQTVVKCLPFGHIASLLRQAIVTDAIDVSFEGMPQSVVDEYISGFGVVMSWGDKKIDIHTSLIFIISVMLISLILFFVNHNRKKKEI